MDVECYLAQKMMRERMADAQANAEVARLLRESNERSGRYGGGGRFMETGRSLANTARKVAFAIFSALTNGVHAARHRVAHAVRSDGGTPDDDDEGGVLIASIVSELTHGRVEEAQRKTGPLQSERRQH